MAQRKIWTKDEDRVLREIIIDRKIRKWSAIARCMETQYKLYGRTGKQCRERWHNQLDPNINNEEWSREEEEILFRCHNENGNKWAKIALHLPGRTDNNIKNHFYSTLRKGLRKLNKVIMDIKYNRQFKEFKGNILSKLITVAEDKFDRKLNVSEQLRERCVQLKIRLIDLSKDETEVVQEECVKLAKEIMEFNRSYRKRKSKKRRNESEEEDDDTIVSSEREKLVVVNNPPQPVVPAPIPKPITNSPAALKDRKTESRNFLPLTRKEKSNHQEEDANDLGLGLLLRKRSSAMRSPLLFGGHRISYLLDSNPDFSQPMLNLDTSGNMNAFNNLNFGFLGNSQQLFTFDDQQQKIEDDPRQVTPVKNLF